jgi:hypothetical protein
MIPPEQERDSIKPYAVSVAKAAHILDAGESTIWEKLAKGELTALKDGVRTKVLMESIERHVASWPKAQFKPPPNRPRRTR